MNNIDIYIFLLVSFILIGLFMDLYIIPRIGRKSDKDILE